MENSNSNTQNQDPILSHTSNFDWITDKNLLRDEGVYYGLSETNDFPEQKVNTIKSYFEEQINIVNAAIDFADKQIDKINQVIKDNEAKISSLQNQVIAWQETFSLQTHDLLRFLLGFTAYAGMAFFNYWLIFEWLSSSGINNALVVSLALYIFGSYSLFSRFSVLYSSYDETIKSTENQRESWKIYLEEIGIPLIVSFFTVYKGWSAHAPMESVLFFLLLFGIFLFSGKGFLNIVIRLKQDFIIWKRNLSIRKAFNEKLKSTRVKISELEQENNELREKREATEHTKNQHQQSNALLKEQKETNVALFLSEVELARTTRNSLNKKQLSQLISTRR